MVVGQSYFVKRSAAKGLQSVASAHLLVLGASQVGKSALIVRFMTGRFIETYSSETTDWLYKQPLLSSQQTAKSVELLEQPDVIPDTNGEKEVACNSSTTLCARDNQYTSRHRTLKDQIHERRRLLEKLSWSHASIVVYAINSQSSFEKASRYLEVALCHQPKGPVLLIANKIDLDGSPLARRVSSEEGCELAARYGCLFSELSCLKTADGVRQAIERLTDRISYSDLELSTIQQAQPQLTYWLSAKRGDQQSVSPLDGIATQLTPCRAMVSGSKLQGNGGPIDRYPKPVDLRPVYSPAPPRSADPVASGYSHRGAGRPDRQVDRSKFVTHTCGRPSVSSYSSISSSASSEARSSSSLKSYALSAVNVGSRRYATLKSTFRRASLALVGSRPSSDGVREANKSAKAGANIGRASLGAIKICPDERGTPENESSWFGLRLGRLAGRNSNRYGRSSSRERAISHEPELWPLTEHKACRKYAGLSVPSMNRSNCINNHCQDSAREMDDCVGSGTKLISVIDSNNSDIGWLENNLRPETMRQASSPDASVCSLAFSPAPNFGVDLIQYQLVGSQRASGQGERRSKGRLRGSPDQDHLKYLNQLRVRPDSRLTCSRNSASSASCEASSSSGPEQAELESSGSEITLNQELLFYRMAESRRYPRQCQQIVQSMRENLLSLKANNRPGVK